MVATGTFADRLEELFAEYEAAHGKPASNRAVAKFLTWSTGENHSGTFVKQLRSGEATDPRLSIVLGLARFFDTAPARLLTGGNAADDKARAGADHDDRLPAAMLRLTELDPSRQRHVLDAIDSVMAMLDERDKP